MVNIFATASALLTPNLVESFKPEKLAATFIKVEKEYGVKFNKTNRTFNIVGDWQSVRNAHKGLQRLVSNPANDDLKETVRFKSNHDVSVTKPRPEPDGESGTPDITEKRDSVSKAQLAVKGNPKRGRHTDDVVPEPVVYLQYQEESYLDADKINMETILDNYEKTQTDKKVTKADLKKILDKNTEQMGRPLNKRLPRGACLPLKKAKKDANTQSENTISSVAPVWVPTAPQYVNSAVNSAVSVGLPYGYTKTNELHLSHVYSDKENLSRYRQQECLSETAWGNFADNQRYSYGNEGVKSQETITEFLNSLQNAVSAGDTGSHYHSYPTVGGSSMIGMQNPARLDQDVTKSVSVMDGVASMYVPPQHELITMRDRLVPSNHSVAEPNTPSGLVHNISSDVEPYTQVAAVTNIQPTMVPDIQLEMVTTSSQSMMIPSVQPIIDTQTKNMVPSLQTENFTILSTVDTATSSSVSIQSDPEMLPQVTVTMDTTDTVNTQPILSLQNKLKDTSLTVTSSMVTKPDLQTDIPLVEFKKFLSAYEFRRHLEPSCTQPSSCNDKNSQLVCTIASGRTDTASHITNQPQQQLIEKRPLVYPYLAENPQEECATDTQIKSQTQETVQAEYRSGYVFQPELNYTDKSVESCTNEKLTEQCPTDKRQDNVSRNSLSKDEFGTQGAGPNEAGDSRGTSPVGPICQQEASANTENNQNLLKLTTETKRRIQDKESEVVSGLIVPAPLNNTEMSQSDVKDAEETVSKPAQTKKKVQQRNVKKKEENQTLKRTGTKSTEDKSTPTSSQKPKTKTVKSKAAKKKQSAESTENGNLDNADKTGETTSTSQTVEEEKAKETKGESGVPKRNEKKVYPCSECDYKGSRKKRLTEHMGRVHGLLTENCRGSQEMTYFSCDLCDKTFVFGKDLNRHKKIVHHGQLYFCNQCQKSYKSKYVYDKHMRTHEEGYVRPMFPCQICERQFTTKFSLGCHIKSEHLGLKKTFICPTCGKTFSQVRSYRQHANVHAGIRPYVCEICGKAFTYDKSLKEHRYMHDNIRRFSCTVCDKAFRQRTCLLIHMKVHKETRDHICSSCGKGFTQRQSLLRHERTHTGDKPYACKICYKTFSDYAVIRKHILSSHKKNKQELKEYIFSEKKKLSSHYIAGGPGYVPRETCSQIREKNSATVLPPKQPGDPTLIIQKQGHENLNSADKTTVSSVSTVTYNKEVVSSIPSGSENQTTELTNLYQSYPTAMYSNLYVGNQGNNVTTETFELASGTKPVECETNMSGTQLQIGTSQTTAHQDFTLAQSHSSVTSDETIVAAILKAQAQGRQQIGIDADMFTSLSNLPGVNVISLEQTQRGQGQTGFSMPSVPMTTVTTDTVLTMPEVTIATSQPTWNYADYPSYYNSSSYSQFQGSQNN